jgi:hypothetical protein
MGDPSHIGYTLDTFPGIQIFSCLHARRISLRSQSGQPGDTLPSCHLWEPDLVNIYFPDPGDQDRVTSRAGPWERDQEGPPGGVDPVPPDLFSALRADHECRPYLVDHAGTTSTSTANGVE